MAVITISREYGSGGSAIAGLICEQLDYRYFDKDLMARLGIPADLKTELAAANAGEDPAESHDDLGLLGRFFRNLQAASPLGQQEGLKQEGELSRDAIERFVRIAYDEDNVVVVGRGGQMVLGDKPDVLHVRVIAPLETRVPVVAQYEGLTADVALERIQARDRAAANYVRQNYRVDIADPCLYDIVINTSRLTWEAGAGLVIHALQYLAPRPAQASAA
jgi:cytidylate kinase